MSNLETNPLTNLYLIRHGEAAYQRSQVVPGIRGDTGLSPLGVEQAGKLRDRLAASGEIKATTLIASSLPRARQTAEIIAPALGLPVVLDDDLHETRPGEADGLTYEEADARYGGPPDFRTLPWSRPAPGSENWPEFMVRVGSTLHRLTTRYRGSTLVVVCHGGVIDASFTYFFGLSSLAMPPVILYTQNTAITHWQQGLLVNYPEMWRLVSYNDDAHLREPAAGQGQG